MVGNERSDRSEANQQRSPNDHISISQVTQFANQEQHQDESHINASSIPSLPSLDASQEQSSTSEDEKEDENENDDTASNVSASIAATMGSSYVSDLSDTDLNPKDDISMPSHREAHPESTDGVEIDNESGNVDSYNFATLVSNNATIGDIPPVLSARSLSMSSLSMSIRQLKREQYLKSLWIMAACILGVIASISVMLLVAFVARGNYLKEMEKDIINPAKDMVGETISRVREAILETTTMSNRVGVELSGTRTAHYPIIFVPGITSTAMEIWKGRPCAKDNFRDKFWGQDTAKTMLRDIKCFFEHLGLDSETWGDPDGIRLRPSTGFSSADYLFPGYWVWAKVFENLNDVGYEPKNMHFLSYDWRLSLPDLETRFGVYKEMRHSIEQLSARNKNRKVVIVSHSMGGLVVQHFLQWAMFNMGTKWIDDHLESWVNLAGALLGVPKSVSAILSGEMKDTAEFGRFSKQMVGSILGTGETIRFFRSLGSLPSMLPLGATSMWQQYAADPTKPFDLLTFGPIKESILKSASDKDIPNIDRVVIEPIPSLDDYKKWIDNKKYNFETYVSLFDKLLPRYMKLVKSKYALQNTDIRDDKGWYNSLSFPLPIASNFKVYCMYGLLEENATTEIGYFYEVDGNLSEIATSMYINTTVQGHPIRNGVVLGPGDATVPLASLSYPCMNWKHNNHHSNPRDAQRKYSFATAMNPGNSPITIREYIHGKPTAGFQASQNMWKEELTTMLRGGEFAASHVEILGNREFLHDLLMIVTRSIDGAPETELADQIQSDSYERFVKAMNSQQEES